MGMLKESSVLSKIYSNNSVGEHMFKLIYDWLINLSQTRYLLDLLVGKIAFRSGQSKISKEWTEINPVEDMKPDEQTNANSKFENLTLILTFLLSGFVCPSFHIFASSGGSSLRRRWRREERDGVNPTSPRCHCTVFLNSGHVSKQELCSWI